MFSGFFLVNYSINNQLFVHSCEQSSQFFTAQTQIRSYGWEGDFLYRRDFLFNQSCYNDSRFWCFWQVVLMFWQEVLMILTGGFDGFDGFDVLTVGFDDFDRWFWWFWWFWQVVLMVLTAGFDVLTVGFDVLMILTGGFCFWRMYNKWQQVLMFLMILTVGFDGFDVLTAGFDVFDDFDSRFLCFWWFWHKVLFLKAIF